MLADTKTPWQTYASAWLNAQAQVVFLSTPLQGFLFLLALSLFSPWSAAGMALGALMALFICANVLRQHPLEWSNGFNLFDGAVIGLLWAGLLSRDMQSAILLAMAIAACYAMRFKLVSTAYSYGFPSLGVASLITLWAAIYVTLYFGGDFWSMRMRSEPGALSMCLAGMCLLAAMLLQNVRAALFALAGSGLAALLFYFAQDYPPPVASTIVLGFTVFLVLFSLPATLLPGHAKAYPMAALAGLVTLGLELAWPHLNGLSLVPSLMAPMFLGIWVVFAFFKVEHRLIFLDPGVQTLAKHLREASSQGGAVVLTGAGISTASGIPDYTGGDWLEAGVPLATYNYASFVHNRYSRLMYWNSCFRFLKTALQAQANPAHLTLTALQQAGFITTVMTQNVDGLHQKAGTERTVELHGNIDHVHCLICGSAQAWPEPARWQHSDAFCECGGFLKPAVIAFGEDISLTTWLQAQQAVSTCSVMLVIGTQVAVSSALALIEQARQRKVPCYFIMPGYPACVLTANDRLLFYKAESLLPALAAYLGLSKAKP
jgi:NAD-dependent deacetylase